MAVKKRLIDLLKEDLQARKVRVDVLGVAVYVTPITVGEQTLINAKHPDDTTLQMAEMLVLKCRDENGEPVFVKDDKTALKREVAADRLGPVIGAINGRSTAVQAKN